MTSFSLNYFLGGSISKYSQTVVIGVQHMDLGGTQTFGPEYSLFSGFVWTLLRDLLPSWSLCMLFPYLGFLKNGAFYCPFTLYRTIQATPVEQVMVTCLMIALWHCDPRWLVCSAKFCLFSLLGTLMNITVSWLVLSSLFFFLRVGFRISVSCLELLWLLAENILNWVKRPKKKNVESRSESTIVYSSVSSCG